MSRIAAILLLAIAAAPASEEPSSVITSPPLVIQIERGTFAVTLEGADIPIPAGSVIAACDDGTGRTLSYELDSRAVRVLAPCREFDPDAVFVDGFEP